MFGGRSRGPHVSIAKAENGYMVTLIPGKGFDDDEDMDVMPFPGSPPEPHQVKALLQYREKKRPRIFVFPEIEQAWDAVKEFLLDGRMPKTGP